MANISTPGSRRALLLIDFQSDFIADDGRMPVDRGQVTPVLTAARQAIDQAQRDGQLIVKIGNEFRHGDLVGNLMRRRAALAGSNGAQWDDRVEVSDASYLPKWKADAFCNPELHRLLASHGVDQVTLTGLYAKACVTATAKGALARGLRVIVLRDAVACKSDASRLAALERLAGLGAELGSAVSDHRR